MNDKISSLVGFAIRANKVIFGLDELDEGKRKRYLIMYCSTMSDRAKQAVRRVGIRDKVPLLETKVPLADLVHKNNIKAIGIANKQMADAILKYITEDYLLIKSEEI